MSLENHVKAKFKSPIQKAIINIRFTSNWIGNYHNNQLSNFGLTLPQFNILRILRGANEPLSINLVRDRMLEKSPNVTRLVDKLIQKQMVTRDRAKKDKRVIKLQITAHGLMTLEQLDQVFDDINASNLLSHEEAEQLNILLDKLRGE
ncbi:MAG: winged helix-turn-helix transcriptional regulator [Crocinitomicaceae bacterium]|nr:winged helix-turn-helix transcriptional regulator [Crocinitomicaceae bacterium]